MNFSYAESTKKISYQNQREEVFDLENFLKETHYNKKEVDSTCSRQIPYVENVCRNETHYRQECRNVLGHQECRTVNNQVCRNETRYENECYWEPGVPSCQVVIRYRRECNTRGGGRVCRQVPPDIICQRAPNGEQKCQKIPAHEECGSGRDEEVCNQVPYEERECISGRGQQICHQVPRQNQVCENQASQQCDWIPDRNVCSNIPYEENVCKDETLYRQETYACKKTIDIPYDVILTTHNANVVVDFLTTAATTTPEFNFSLSSKGDLLVSGTDQDSQKSIVFVKKEIQNNVKDKVNSIEAKFKIAVFDRSDFFKFVDNKIKRLSLGKDSLSFYFPGKIDVKRAKLSVLISKKNTVKFEKVLDAKQFSLFYDGFDTKVTVDIGKYGSPKLGGVFNKKHNVVLKLSLNYSDVGDIIIPEGRNNVLTSELDQDVNVE